MHTSTVMEWQPVVLAFSNFLSLYLSMQHVCMCSAGIHA